MAALAGVLALAAAPRGDAATNEVSGPLTGEIRWTEDNVYVLTGYTYVLSNAVLRIDPGTVVKGRNGTAPNFGALYVCQGGKIQAEGTAQKPIIFTAEDDDLEDFEDLRITDRGLWGGVVLLGNARINKAVNAAGDAADPKYEVYEGLEDLVINGQNVHRFGGANDDDSSGVLRYVSIRHGGQRLSPDKEINGLSLGGVGRGTVVEYVEAISFADDGFEFFGGTVNTKYLVSAFNDDDAFDTDMGWSGKNQFWFALQSNDRRDNGSEQNGEPNERNDGTGIPVSTYEIYNATMVGAGASAGGTANNHAMLIRRYTQAGWYNSIFTEFNGQPLNGGGPQTGSAPKLTDNIWWNFAAPVFTNDLFTSASFNNSTNLNPMLRGVSREADGGLDPRPMSGSPALTAGKVTPEDGFYTAASYKGAFGEKSNWARGWSFLEKAGFLPASDSNEIIVGTQAITGDVTWSAANSYLLTNYVYVLSNAVLRIEAGTVIKGRNGTAPNFGTLFICQGGKILAEGTAQRPIIFTAEVDDIDDAEDLLITDRGLWGGLVILGNARINKAVNAAGDASSPKFEVYEGLDDVQINGQNVHRFGGDNDDDNSGVLRYVSIRHGGQRLSPDKEINGVSFGGVGRGTLVEHVEALSFADDGFEFFGGSVNTKHLVSAFNDDDAFDTDMGWSGKNQFWFGIQSNDRRDSGSEQNGEPNERNDGTGVPVATYEIYNATLIGAGAQGGGTANNHAMLIRRYNRAGWYNSIFTDFNGQPFNGGGPQTGSAPTLMDNLWWGFAAPVFTNELFTTTANNNFTTLNPEIRGIGREADGGLDPRPVPGSPAFTSTRKPPTDGFYSPVDYKGAFSNESNWSRGWSYLSTGGFLPPSDVNDVMVSAPISGDVTWRASNTYILTNYVYVLSNAVLRIEAGTVIKGRNGTAPNFGTLFVCQGGRILAEGTPDRPIVFTTEEDDVNDPFDLLTTDRGLWGGLVILGNARINKAVSAAGDAANPKYEVYEGLEDIQINGQFVHRYGGMDDDDNSGVLRYVSLRHGGQRLSPDKEINGLSLGGVGRGTTIEYVEAVSFADDGFEFFGGSVNTKYLVSAFNDDDSFDMDMGWSGKNQFWFALQSNDRRDNGSEQNGEPNERNDGTGVPAATYEIYNATLVGAGAGGQGADNNHAMLVRRYNRSAWYNSILTDFHGQPFNGGAPQTGSSPMFMDNIWWGFSTPVFTNDVFVTVANNNTTNLNPQLRGLGRERLGSLDPRPLPGSPALTSPRTAPTDGFYHPVAYRGAFDDKDNWLRRWTSLSERGLVPMYRNEVFLSNEAISGDVTWSATNVYLLSGYTYVLNGATLRIEPGTVIKGRNGTAPNFGSLFVCQGGKLLAEGTPHNPIIFTAETDDLTDTEDLLITDRGLWGGVVLLGNARINKAVNAAGDAATPKFEVFEGLEDRQIQGQFVHRFGGADDNDSSGVMRYVSIRHGGQRLSPDKEINGLSLGGVGRGTVIENVEVLSFADDGFEFFGGSVNTKYLVSAFNDDDAFDTDMGWNGKNQFWFSIQSNDRRDSGSEQNGEPNERNDGTGVPVATYEIYNSTLIGAGASAGGAANNHVMLLRRYVQAGWHNSIFTDFNGQPFNGGGPQTGAAPSITDNLWWGFATPVFTNDVFTVAGNNNVTTADPMLVGISRDADAGLDPRLLVGSPAIGAGRRLPGDGFYSVAGYQGAFLEQNWASDWTALSAYGILSAAGGRNPMDRPATTPGEPATLVVAREAGGLRLTWTGGQAPYTVQRKSALGDAAWTDLGVVQEPTFLVPAEGVAGFLRVVSP